MRVIALLAVLALGVSTVSVDAQGRGNGQAKRQGGQGAQTTRVKGNAPAAKPTSDAATRRGPKADARVTRPETKADARAARTEAKAARAEARAARTTTSPVPTTEVTPTTPTTRTVKNPRLEARLLGMLPPGTTVQDAMAGFKNWGQFVAAVHVSNNLGIPFADLKAKMTGLAPGTTPGTTVPTAPLSLGQAIQSLRGATSPAPDGTLTEPVIRTEVKKAEDAANEDLRRTRG